MIAQGEFPPIDAAVFADTRHEPKEVYDYLDWFEAEVARSPNPFPVYRVSAGDLWEAATMVRTSQDGKTSYIETAIPVFTLEGLQRGRGKRQCTTDFKVVPVQQKVREMFDIEHFTAADGVRVEMLIGFSTDEIWRVKPSREAWIEKSFPLIDANMRRGDCFAWMDHRGYPRPPRSACEFCPFRTDQEWMALGEVVLARVATTEPELQDAYRRTGTLTSTPYLHSSRVPFSQVTFDMRSQLDLHANDCEGFCGT